LKLYLNYVIDNKEYDVVVLATGAWLKDA